MKVMSKKVDLSTRVILDLARSFFGDRFGLEIREDIPSCCIEFANDMGFVAIQILDEGLQRDVIVTTREFEYQILEFLNSLAHAS